MAAKKKEAEFRFELDGEVLEIDIDGLTFGEVEFLESYFDKGMGEIPLESARGMMALTAIVKVRQNPENTNYQFELARLRGIKVEAFKKAPAAKRPTKPKPETSGSPS
jgi:hypothetical protein